MAEAEVQQARAGLEEEHRYRQEVEEDVRQDIAQGLTNKMRAK